MSIELTHCTLGILIHIVEVFVTLLYDKLADSTTTRGIHLDAIHIVFDAVILVSYFGNYPIIKFLQTIRGVAKRWNICHE